MEYCLKSFGQRVNYGVAIPFMISICFRFNVLNLFPNLALFGVMFSFLLLPKSLAAEEYCVEQWACAGVQEADEQYRFWISNQKAFPITMTLIVKSRNLQDTDGKKGRFEITRVIRGFERFDVLTLFPSSEFLSARYNYDFKWIPGDKDAKHNDRYRYKLPFAANANHRLVQGFNGGYSHRGASKYALDFAMSVGTPVHAAREGTVIDLKEDSRLGGPSRRYARYANYIVVLHNDGTTGEYYHLKYKGAEVRVGQKVQAGQFIGYSGNTGFSSLPHLHFAVYRAKSHGGYESLPIKFSRTPNASSWAQYGTK